MYKYKLKRIYDTYREKEGTIQTEETLTNQSRADEVDINKCLEKYGNGALLNQTIAKENLFDQKGITPYGDTEFSNMTLDEAVRQKENLQTYFNNMPARARKVFGDSPEQFIEKYKRGEFKDFIKTGALTEEQVNSMLTNEEKRTMQQQQEIINKYRQQLETELNNVGQTKEIKEDNPSV